MKSVWNILTILYVFGYFLLTEFARPKIVETRGIQIWWWTLAAFVTLTYLVSMTVHTIRKTAFTYVSLTVTFVLYGLTLFLFDPLVIEQLRDYKLGGLWVVSTLVLFAWLWWASRSAHHGL
jgi:hypothetical protein